MGHQTKTPHDGHDSELTRIVHRNIRALVEERHKLEASKSRQLRVANAITPFTGSMRFVYLHALLFGGWFVVNLGWLLGVRPFDPFPFVMLAMRASVEAIFLSTFVLISQNLWWRWRTSAPTWTCR